MGSNDTIEFTPNWNVIQVYGPRYEFANDKTVEHLVFSLKYDDLNLAFLKVAFEKIPEPDIINYIAVSTTGKYVRKIGFLYEFFIQKQLNIFFSISGNYVDLL